MDPQQPLSAAGVAHAARLAERVRDSGFVPAAIWHSGKLRTRQTAEPFWRACNPFADFRMIRGAHPEDGPAILVEALTGETRDILIAGHIPNLTATVQALLGDAGAVFPPHGAMALERDAQGKWSQIWQLDAEE